MGGGPVGLGGASPNHLGATRNYLGITRNQHKLRIPGIAGLVFGAVGTASRVLSTYQVFGAKLVRESAEATTQKLPARLPTKGITGITYIL